MPKIAGFEVMVVKLPIRREHKWAGLSEPIGKYVLVRATSDEGVSGWGEAPALKEWGGEFGRYYGESPLITRLVIEKYLVPALVDLEVGDIIGAHARMDAAIKGYPYAKAAIEFALYDVAARTLGVPVHYLLGGRSRATIAITHSIGLLGLEEAERESVQVASEGIKTIKIKVGVDPDRDVAVVRRIRDAVGPSVKLCIDANEGYKTPGEAVRTVRRMSSCDLIYVEQPVMGIERLAEVARAIDEPVMADESSWNGHDVVQIIEARAADIVSLYTTKAGGLFKAMEAAAVCRSAGIVCNVNGSVESGIGNLCNLQLAAAAPAVTLSCVLPISRPAHALNNQVGGVYYSDDLITDPMHFEDGAISVPVAAGMGIDVDPAKIAKYRVADE